MKRQAKASRTSNPASSTATAARWQRRGEQQQETTGFQDAQQLNRDWLQERLQVFPLLPAETHANGKTANNVGVLLGALNVRVAPAIVEPVEEMGRVGDDKVNAVVGHVGQHVPAITRMQRHLRSRVAAQKRLRQSLWAHVVRRDDDRLHGFDPIKRAQVRRRPIMRTTTAPIKSVVS